MPVRTDAVAVLTPQEEREAFAREFPGAVPDDVSDGKIVVGRKAPREASGASEHEIRFLSRLMGLDYRMQLQGVTPATILNMNPYTLQVNSTLMGDIVCPPAPAGKPYSITVIRDYRISRDESDSGDASPVPWVPIILAREFEQLYYNNGGVVVYGGDGEKDPPAVASELDKKLKHKILAAKERQIEYAKKMVREASNEYNTPNHAGVRNISDIHRELAKLLHDITGQELPVWIERVPGQYGLGEQCPRCKAIPQSGAYACPSCGKVLDPRQAFERGDIDIDHAELRTLDRKVLEDMGISELIDETFEERNKTLRERADAIRKEKRAGRHKTEPAQTGQ